MAHTVARCLVPAALALSALAGAAHADVINDYNLIVLGNLSSNSEVEGRTFVGGNLTTSSSNYGVHLTPASSYLNTDVLTVGGSISGGNIQMNAGNLRLGGSVTGNVNYNGGGHLINDPSAASMWTSIDAVISADSAALAAMSPNSTLQLPSGQPGPALFVCAPNAQGVAVFSINGSLFSNGLVQSIDIQLNGATNVVVNVTGGSINYNGGNMIGGLNAAFASHIIWNFPTATSIDIQRQFFGALLAPDAALHNSTTIVGSVAVSSFNQQGEVHLPNYQGLVPTPGAAALAGMAGLLASRRRR